jgi:hypothetical protein
MCIERNRDILFGRGGEKAAVAVTSATAAAMQLVLPNPTTLAIPATAGLVHCGSSWPFKRRGDPNPADIQAGLRPRECSLADNPIKRETIAMPEQ